MKYCGVVTDSSWMEANRDKLEKGTDNWNWFMYFSIPSDSGKPWQIRRIYSDEVPMADEKTIIDIYCRTRSALM